jgi:hypothetical protein
MPGMPHLSARTVRHLAVCALFALLLWGGDRLGAALLSRLLDRSHDTLAELYGGTAQGDIVVLGNSRAYRHFDFAARPGPRLVNLAQPGASTLLSSVLLEDYVDRYGAPRAVVLELSGLVADQDAVLVTRMFAPRSPRLAALLRAWHQRYFWGGQVSHLFAYNNAFALNVAHKIIVPMPPLLLDGRLTAARMAALRDAAGTEYFRSRPENLRALDDIIALARREGFALHSVISPIAPTYAAVSGYPAWRGDLAARLAGVAFSDFGTGLVEAPSLFADDLHMNRDGVARFMDVLAAKGFITAQ